MSKLWFRARALDAAKPLPVYRNRELPELADLLSVSRSVPQMPSGMEKEEELVGARFESKFVCSSGAIQDAAPPRMTELFCWICAGSVATAGRAPVAFDV